MRSKAAETSHDSRVTFGVRDTRRRDMQRADKTAATAPWRGLNVFLNAPMACQGPSGGTLGIRSFDPSPKFASKGSPLKVARLLNFSGNFLDGPGPSQCHLLFIIN